MKYKPVFTTHSTALIYSTQVRALVQDRRRDGSPGTAGHRVRFADQRGAQVRRQSGARGQVARRNREVVGPAADHRRAGGDGRAGGESPGPGAAVSLHPLPARLRLNFFLCVVVCSRFLVVLFYFLYACFRSLLFSCRFRSSIAF